MSQDEQKNDGSVKELGESRSISSLLMTDAGRMALGAQLSTDVREQLTSGSLARMLLSAELPATGGMLPVVTLDDPLCKFAATIAYNEEVAIVTDITNPNSITPVTHEYMIPASVRLRDIQKRISDNSSENSQDIALAELLQDGIVSKIVSQLAYLEDRELIKLLAHTCAKSRQIAVINRKDVNRNFSVKDSADTYAKMFRKAVIQTETGKSYTDADIEQLSYYLVMNAHTMEFLRPSLQAWDCNNSSSWKISSAVPNYEVYVVIRNFKTDIRDDQEVSSEEIKIGYLSVRTNTILLLNDEPQKAAIGFVGYEELTTSINWPSRILKIKIV